MKYTESKNTIVKNKNAIKKFYYDRVNLFDRSSQEYFELRMVTSMALYYQDDRFLKFCWFNRDDGTHDEFLKNDNENLKKSMTEWAKSYSDKFNNDWRKFKYFSFNEEFAHQIEIEQVEEVKEEKQKIKMGFY